MILLELCSDLDLLNQASNNHGIGGATAANLSCWNFIVSIVCTLVIMIVIRLAIFSCQLNHHHRFASIIFIPITAILGQRKYKGRQLLVPGGR